MQYGELLRRTRKAAGLTQEEMGEKLFCATSSISKLETDNRTLYIDRAVKWMDIVKRQDIIYALLSGLESDRIIKYLFEEEYLSKVKDSELLNNLNEELTIEDIENYVLNKTEEAIQWKKYLTELKSV